MESNRASCANGNVSFSGVTTLTALSSFSTEGTELLSSWMYGRTVGTFRGAIFRSPLVWRPGDERERERERERDFRMESAGNYSGKYAGFSLKQRWIHGYTNDNTHPHRHKHIGEMAWCTQHGGHRGLMGLDVNASLVLLTLPHTHPCNSRCD